MLLAHESALAKVVAIKSSNRPQREAMTKLVQALDARHELVWETLQSMDTNRNATLDREELFNGLDSLGVRLAPTELDAVMAHLDADGSGSIDYIEFFNAISNFDVNPSQNVVESYVVAIRCVGLTSMSSTSSSLARSLTEQIDTAYGVADPADGESDSASPWNADTNQALWVAMRHASREQPLYIFVDGVDRLLLSDGTIDIDWLPVELPTHVKLVITIAETSTAAKSGAFARMIQVLPQGNSVELARPVGSDAAASVMQNWLAAAEGRLLKQEHLDEAVRASSVSNGSLLCLHVMRSIATLWTSATLPARLKLPSNLSSALSAFFEMVDSRHPCGLLEAALLYLVGAHIGVTELELDDLLALHDDLLLSACPWLGADSIDQSVCRLPSHFVPRLLADLRPLLIKLPAVGHAAPVWTWAHQQFKLAASFHVGMATKSAEVAECFAGYLGGDLVVLHSTTVSERLRARSRRALDEQPLWRGTSPNVRIAVELLQACESAGLWLSIHAQLTSINFIEAKFASGLAHELAGDYSRLALVDLGRADAMALEQFKSFIERNMDVLRRAPHRTLQAAMLEPAGSYVRRDAEAVALAAARGDIGLIRFATALASASDLQRSPAWLQVGKHSGAADGIGDADADESGAGTSATLSGTVELVRWKLPPPLRRKPSWLLGEPFVPADPCVSPAPTACAVVLGRGDWADTVHVLVATCDASMAQHSCSLSRLMSRRVMGSREKDTEAFGESAEGGGDTAAVLPLQVIDGLGAPVHALEPTPPTSPWAGFASASVCSAVLWEMRSGLLYELARLEQHTAPITCLGFSPHGAIVVTADSDGVLKLSRACGSEIGACLRTITLPALPVAADGDDHGLSAPLSASVAIRSLSWAPDGEYMLIGVASLHIFLLHVIWDGDETEGNIEQLKFSLQRGHTGTALTASAFAPSGEMALTGAADGTITLWTCLRAMTEGGHRRMKLRPAAQLAKQSHTVAAVAFSQSSRCAIALGTYGSITCWDVQTHAATACVGAAAPFGLASTLCMLPPLVGVAELGHAEDSYSEDAQDSVHPVLLASVGHAGVVDLLSVGMTTGSAASHGPGSQAERDAVQHRAALGALGSVSALAFSPDADLLVRHRCACYAPC
jgi:WD40 repeat protein